MSNENENPTTPEKLTREEFEKICNAYGRLLDLRDAKVHTVNRDAEIKGLVEYLSESFINYAPEFLGTWNVVRTEYEPLVNVFASVLPRVQGILNQRIAIQKAHAEAAAKNITPLVQP